jgi:DNA-binding transcriptional LysR family regulator
MEFSDLEAFVVVAESKSVKVAGAKMKLSQSAVTRRLQNFEQSVGSVLIHREARPLVLTPEGAEAYKHSKNILSAIDSMRAAMAPDAEMKGEFRLGISMSIGDTLLARSIENLCREFKNLQIQVVVDESHTLMKKVERRDLDAVVILLIDDARVPEGLSGDMLSHDAMGVVAAKSLAIRSPARLADLLDYPWALNPPGCSARDELTRVCNRLSKPLHILVESSGSALKLELIEKGFGLGLAREKDLSASKRADQLCFIVPTDFKHRIGMWLVYSPNIGRLRAPVESLKRTLQTSKAGETGASSSARRKPSPNSRG